MFAAYCGLFALVRLSFATSLLPADATEHYLAQEFAFSYGVSSPPLHTWLFLVLERLMGPGLGTSQLLDSILLIVAFASIMRTARLAGLSGDAAAVAGWSLFLLPPFMGSLSEYTEATALACVVAITLEAAVKVNERHAPRDYVRLGLIFALGTLTRYVYIVLPAAIALAVVLLARWRKRWIHAELVYSLLPAMLLWPVLTGFLDRVEPELATLAAEKSAVRALGIHTTGIGLLALGQAVLMYAGPLALAALVARPWRPGRRELPSGVVFLGHITVVAVVLVVAGVIVAAVSDVSAADLHVALLAGPILVAAWTWRDTKPLPAAYLALVAVAATGVMGKNALDVSPYCRGTCEERIPYAALAEALGPLPAGTTVVASDPSTAGNLRRFYPRTRVVAATFPWEPARPSPVRACVTVVDPRIRPDTPPATLLDFAEPASEPVEDVVAPAPGYPDGYAWQVQRVSNPAACP